MPFPIVFGSLAAGNQPLSDFDTQFAAVGALVEIPCTASGQNTVILTPAANTPTITAYTNFAPTFRWVQAQTSTGPVTIQVAGGLAALNAYKNNGATAVGANDLVATSSYSAYYNSALNSGAGGFVVDVVPTALVAPGAVQGSFKNLVVTNTTATAAAHQIVVTADALALFDGSTTYSTALSVNFTIDANTSGAGGIDTGTFTASTWYAVYAIQNTSSGTVTGVISTSFTAPALPTGYARFMRCGTARSNATPAFVNFMQKGRGVQNVVGTYNGNALAVVPTMTAGVAGTYSVTSPTLATVSLSGFVPPTAAKIIVAVSNNYLGGTISGVIVAPNTSFGGTNNGPSGSNGQNYPIWLGTASSTTVNATMIIESTTIAWASSAAGGALACLGYEDNL